MPEGLQAGLTPEEFADLIAYLETLTLATPAAGFEVSGTLPPGLLHRRSGDRRLLHRERQRRPGRAGQQRLHHQARPAGPGRRAQVHRPLEGRTTARPEGARRRREDLVRPRPRPRAGVRHERGDLVLDIDMSPYKAAFLNDLTRDAEGNLYLSDSQSNFVARIEPAHEHRVTILARGPQLAGANGLSVQPKTGRLAVVTWGTGRVLEVTKAGRGQALARPEIREARRCRLRRRRQPLLLRLRRGKGLPGGRGRQGLRLPRRARHARGHQHRPGEEAVAHPFLRRGLGPGDPAGEMTSATKDVTARGPIEASPTGLPWAMTSPARHHPYRASRPPHGRAPGEARHGARGRHGCRASLSCCPASRFWLPGRSTERSNTKDASPACRGFAFGSFNLIKALPSASSRHPPDDVRRRDVAAITSRSQ